MKKILLLVCALGLGMQAQAQEIAKDNINAVITKKAIRLFANAGDTEPVREVSVDDFKKLIAMPIAILQEDGERVQIDVEKQAMWVNTIGFKVHRACKVEGVIATTQTDPKGSSRGVGRGAAGCTKS